MSKKDIGKTRHDWLVLMLYESLRSSSFNPTNEDYQTAKVLFESYNTVLENLEEATKFIGNGFSYLEPFYRYQIGKHKFEIDIFGIRDNFVTGIEVKCKKPKRLKYQKSRFADFARKKYAELIPELYYFSGMNGIRLEDIEDY
ncbi:MAG: hypothetical protein QXN71_01615 [Candidatus Aenigmatarchaeota archaeon]